MHLLVVVKTCLCFFQSLNAQHGVFSVPQAQNGGDWAPAGSLRRFFENFLETTKKRFIVLRRASSCFIMLHRASSCSIVLHCVPSCFIVFHRALMFFIVRHRAAIVRHRAVIVRRRAAVVRHRASCLLGKTCVCRCCATSVEVFRILGESKGHTQVFHKDLGLEQPGIMLPQIPRALAKNNLKRLDKLLSLPRAIAEIACS